MNGQVYEYIAIIHTRESKTKSGYCFTSVFLKKQLFFSVFFRSEKKFEIESYHRNAIVDCGTTQVSPR